jgi:hypothetical protein
MNLGRASLNPSKYKDKKVYRSRSLLYKVRSWASLSPAAVVKIVCKNTEIQNKLLFTKVRQLRVIFSRVKLNINSHKEFDLQKSRQT